MITSLSIDTNNDFFSVEISSVLAVATCTELVSLLFDSFTDWVLNSNASTRRFAKSPLVIGLVAAHESGLRILIPAASATSV